MTARARDPSYEQLLDAQGRVIGRKQALTAGLSAEAWRWRTARDGQLLLPGVVLMHKGTPTFAERVQAAIAYGGAGAAVSGDALLHLLDPRRTPEPEHIDIAVRAGAQLASVGFFVPRRCTRLDGLTHPARWPRQLRVGVAVLHAAAWASSDRAAEWRIASAVQRRAVTAQQLRSALVELPALKRRGLIRLVLDDVELGAHARTELDLLAFLRRHRLPRPDRLQLKIRAGGVRYLDAWWERQRVVVEVDGVHHMSVGTWDEDALRANAVVIAHRADRVILLRVTAGNMRHRPAELAAQLAAVLR